MMQFPYQWRLSDKYPAKGIKKHNSNVFSMFACGGGSTMGYKLAGYQVCGINEIDPEMVSIYTKNHNPRIIYDMDIRAFNQIPNAKLPKELLNLDVLDGSPPCSSFSMAGAREEGWQKKKKFREGQAHQILDDLFFNFIETAKKLQPKVVIAENVKGMLAGNAKGYVVEIDRKMKEAGYDVQLFCLNAATMGVPQKRERVFFICHRSDLKLPKLQLKFSEKPITWGEIKDENSEGRKPLSSRDKMYIDTHNWIDGRLQKLKTESKQVGGVGFYYMPRDRMVCSTVISGARYVNHDKMALWNTKEFCRAQSFPEDFDFIKSQPQYVIGMSVPPVMMAQISYQVYLQWLKKL